MRSVVARIMPRVMIELGGRCRFERNGRAKLKSKGLDGVALKERQLCNFRSGPRNGRMVTASARGRRRVSGLNSGLSGARGRATQWILRVLVLYGVVVLVTGGCEWRAGRTGLGVAWPAVTRVVVVGLTSKGLRKGCGRAGRWRRLWEVCAREARWAWWAVGTLLARAGPGAATSLIRGTAFFAWCCFKNPLIDNEHPTCTGQSDPAVPCPAFLCLAALSVFLSSTWVLRGSVLRTEEMGKI